MAKINVTHLSDYELINEFKSITVSPLTDAFLIGFLIGIIIFSVVYNTVGFLTLIPLYLIYLFLKKPKRYKALKDEIASRGLTV